MNHYNHHDHSPTWASNSNYRRYLSGSLAFMFNQCLFIHVWSNRQQAAATNHDDEALLTVYSTNYAEKLVTQYLASKIVLNSHQQRGHGWLQCPFATTHRLLISTTSTSRIQRLLTWAIHTTVPAFTQLYLLNSRVDHSGWFAATNP